MKSASITAVRIFAAPPAESVTLAEESSTATPNVAASFSLISEKFAPVFERPVGGLAMDRHRKNYAISAHSAVKGAGTNIGDGLIAVLGPGSKQDTRVDEIGTAGMNF